MPEDEFQTNVMLCYATSPFATQAFTTFILVLNNLFSLLLLCQKINANVNVENQTNRSSDFIMLILNKINIIIMTSPCLMTHVVREPWP